MVVKNKNFHMYYQLQYCFIYQPDKKYFINIIAKKLYKIMLIMNIDTLVKFINLYINNYQKQFLSIN